MKVINKTKADPVIVMAGIRGATGGVGESPVISLMTKEELKDGVSETARSVNAKLLKEIQTEFSTVAEAQAQIVTGKSIDPKTLGQVTATFDRKGLLMICKPADVYGNVVDTKAASPYAISRSFQIYSSFKETGYQKLPGGLYFQWIRGSAMTNKGVVQRLSFPINFPVAVLNITCSHQIKKFNSNSHQWLQIGEYTTSYCEVYLQSSQAVEEETFPMVLAIGY